MTHDETRTEFDQLIERMAYPTNTEALVDFVRQHGKGDGVVAIATSLPTQTFRNPGEVRSALQSD